MKTENEFVDKETQITDYGMFFSEIAELNKYHQTLNYGKLDQKDIQPYFLKQHSPLYINLKLDEYLRKFQGKDNIKILKQFLLRHLVIIIVYKFIHISAQYGCVYLLDIINSKIKLLDPEDSSKNGQKLYMIFLILFAMLLSFGIQMYSRLRQQWLTVRGQQILNVVLRIMLYRKLFTTYVKTKKMEEQSDKQSQKEKEEEGENKNENQKNSDSRDLNTIITFDLSRVLTVFVFLSDNLASFLEFGVCCLLIYLQVGSVMFMAVGTILFFSFYNVFCIKYYIENYNIRLKEKDQRISLSTDIFNGIKSIKYLGWENIFKDKINTIRSKEFSALTSSKIINGCLMVFWQSLPNILFLVTVISYLKFGSNSGNFNVFTLILIFRMIVTPISVFPWVFESYTQIKKSFGNIQKVLKEEEIDTKNIAHPQYLNDMGVLTKHCEAYFPTVDDQNNHKNETKFILKVKELNIKKGQLIYVVGEIGSGKSAFLQFLLNEMKIKNSVKNNYSNDTLLDSCLESDQKLLINGSIAYVSQNTWLQNQSVKENILFGKKYNKQYYDLCIEACQLLEDISTFPDKHNYQCGPNGAYLSGGQKQRITLCRALYSDADIYLLDDPLSSVDVHVSKALIEECIIKQMVSKGKTVIIATSHYKYLNKGHQIILLKNGEIITNQTLVNDYLKIFEQQEEDLDTKKENLNENIIDLKKDEMQNVGDQLQENEVKNSSKEKKSKSKMIQIYFKAAVAIYILLFLLFLFSTQVCRIIIDFWLKSQIPSLTYNIHTDQIIYIFTSLTIISVLFGIMSTVFYCCWCLSGGYSLFHKINDKLIFSKMVFFDKTHTARIINRISSDINVCDDVLPTYFNQMFQNLLSSLAALLGIIYIIPAALIFLPLNYSIVYQAAKQYIKTMRELKKLDGQYNAQVVNIISETACGVMTIRSLNAQNYMNKIYLKALVPKIMTQMANDALQFWARNQLSIALFLIFFCVIISCGVVMYFDLTKDYARVGLVLTYTIILAQLSNVLIYSFTQAESELASVERIVEYSQNQIEKLDEKINSNQMSNIQLNKLDIDEHKDYIVFQNVKLTYQQNEEINKKYALDDISFKIQKGQKIAFCGRTGSGKTSILNSLFGLYEKESGQIYIKGKEQETMNLRELRSKMAIIPQFGFLYEASFKENLDPEGLFTDNQLQEIIEKSGFQIRGINQQSTSEKQDQAIIQIDQSPNMNLDFQIDKSGSNLSNGQKQIMNFLRILLKDVDIVCLDEATSNMDPETDAKLYKTLFKYTKDKALLVITHRLETIHMYDNINVMEHGKIVESGTYQELKQKEHGFFREVLLNNDII